MSPGSLLLGAALFILVGLFLARPFLLASGKASGRKSSYQELTAQKEAVLAQIEVLDFDFETGTLPELDYKRRRRQLVSQAAETLKQLDDYSEKVNGEATQQFTSEIEAAVATLRQSKPRPTIPAAKPPARTIPSKAPASPAAAPGPSNGRVKFCSQCGRPVDEDDKFCAYCGHQVIPA